MATAGRQVATWTVLFTDMVSSTERRVRVGENVFDRVRADFDRRVDRAVEAHDGTAVKSTGDGILAGFAGTASALRWRRSARTDPSASGPSTSTSSSTWPSGGSHTP